MTTADWYKVLLEKNILFEKNETGNFTLKPSKIESKLPEVDWKRSWDLINTKGLNSEKVSFLVKILYNILPVNSRLFRMKMSISPFCSLCGSDTFDDLSHSLLMCDFNSVVNDWILAVMIDLDPGLINEDLTSYNVVALNFELTTEAKFPIAWFLASAFELVWKRRMTKKPISISNIKAHLGAEIERRINGR